MDDAVVYLRASSSMLLWCWEFAMCCLLMFDCGDDENIPEPWFVIGGVPILSDADSLENASRASGKFGGVAGVFAGVHNCWKK